MPGDLVLLVSVHGFPAAELLREVLVEGGVESVDIRASVGTPYVGRAITVEYDLRVADEDEARARALLAAYSEEASVAANAQANDAPIASEPMETSTRLARKRRMNIAIAAVMLAILVFPVLILLIDRAAQFFDHLFRHPF
jgi:hypothetical protein